MGFLSFLFSGTVETIETIYKKSGKLKTWLLEVENLNEKIYGHFFKISPIKFSFHQIIHHQPSFFKPDKFFSLQMAMICV